jgi:hypothetical protein
LESRRRLRRPWWRQSTNCWAQLAADRGFRVTQIFRYSPGMIDVLARGLYMPAHARVIHDHHRKAPP